MNDILPDAIDALKRVVDLYAKRTGRTDSIADKERQNSEIFNAMMIIEKYESEKNK